MIRQIVHFTGRVQGVGFRFTVIRIASDHKAAGYVQNLPDGRVLLVAEGGSEDLDGLVAAVLRVMGRYVVDHSVVMSQATGEFGKPDFGAISIRY